MSTSIEIIRGLLDKQSSVGPASNSVSSAVGGLKDLCDLPGTGSVDWRRGAAGANSQASRPLFRNQSSSSVPLSPLHKSGSSRSFTSTCSSPGSASPGGSFSSSRYQSRFKNSSQPVNDKILNNIILSKLNKFSGATYKDVRDFLYQILGSGEPDLGEMVRQFMLLVFKKAASEENFCSLYAKLLAEISVRYKVILEEMHKLQANYLEIFEDVEEVPEGGDEYDKFVEKNRDKVYRQGYSQFLAELAALEIMDLSNLEQTFRKLTDLMVKYAAIPDKKTLIEDYTDCLLRMSRVLKKKSSPFFISARNALLTISGETIHHMIANKDAYVSLSPKARFILMDIKDNLTA